MTWHVSGPVTLTHQHDTTCLWPCYTNTSTWHVCGPVTLTHQHDMTCLWPCYTNTSTWHDITCLWPCYTNLLSWHDLPLTSLQLRRQNSAKHSLSSAVLVWFQLTNTSTHALKFVSRSSVVSRQHSQNLWSLGTWSGTLWRLNHTSTSPLYLTETTYKRHFVFNIAYY